MGVPVLGVAVGTTVGENVVAKENGEHTARKENGEKHVIDMLPRKDMKNNFFKTKQNNATQNQLTRSRAESGSCGRDYTRLRGGRHTRRSTG